jgi:SAM-dependent methyltransferase
MNVNEEKLHDLLSKMVVELGAAVTAPLVIIGDKLGLYRTLASEGPLASDELALRTQTNERYVREWLAAQAASGYVEYDSSSKRFFMTPEQVAVFADEQSPVLMTGGFYSLISTFHDEPRLAEAFKSGAGLAWGDHNNCLFCGVAKFFRPSYQAHLVQEWIPALGGVDARLREGVKVADVGCGFGISTIVMAKAYPNSRFYGFDIHPDSIAEAQSLLKRENLTNVEFAVASAKDFPGDGYGFITFFDCLHDMGDPGGASRHVYSRLGEDGTWMIVEPFAHDRLEENLNPVGRLYYAYSTQVCTPTSLSQEVGAALGAQAGEVRLRSMIEPAGFGTVRRATETPFNIILEAKK